MRVILKFQVLRSMREQTPPKYNMHSFYSARKIKVFIIFGFNLKPITMKNLLLLFTLTVASYTNAQIDVFSFGTYPIANVFNLNFIEYPSDNALTVPEGKIWYIKQYATSYILINDDNSSGVSGLILPEGTTISFDAASFADNFPNPESYYIHLNIIEYNLEDTNFSNIYMFKSKDYLGIENALTVPEGKIWYVHKYGGKSPKGTSNFIYHTNSINDVLVETQLIFSEGSKLYGSEPSNSYYDPMNIIEYDLDAQSLASTDTNLKLDNKMQLFPNPTNSRLSLNSEKDYNIEVFDLSGRKIMEAQGNNLDMSNLSKATYIVKAFDKASKETYSYKVIRN